MEAKELRIGNLVKFRSGGIESAIEKIDCSEPHDILIDNTLIDGVDPILLTEERLLKFGFADYDGMGIVYRLKRIELLYEKGLYWFSYARGVEVEITHVHTLQNLCFSLGEELEQP